MRILSLLIILFFNTALIQSQQCDFSFSGYVINSKDSFPLKNATIQIQGISEIVETNSEGYFEFQSLCRKNYSVIISHPNGKTKLISLNLDRSIQKTIELEYQINELDEVIVEGETNLKSRTIFENKISDQIIEDNSSSTLGDLLKNISGVSSINTGNSIIKPIINGLYGSRVDVLNNEVNLQDQQWGIEHAPNIDINSAANISVIKGAGALKYSGSAIGGIVIAEPPKVFLKDSLYGKTVITGGTNGRGGSVSTRLTRSFENGWFTSLQGTYKRFGDFETPDYILSNSGLIDQSASFQIGLNKVNYGFEFFISTVNNDIGIIRASHLHAASDQLRAIKSNQPWYIEPFTYKINPPFQEVKHNIAKFKIFKRFQDFGKLTFQYHFQDNKRLEFDVRRGKYKNIPATNLTLKTHTIMLDFDSDFLNMFDFNYGIKGEFQNNFPSPDTGVKRIIPDYSKYDFGTYFISNFELKKNWVMETGIRYDFSQMNVSKWYRESFWLSRNYDKLYSEIVVRKIGNQILTAPKLKFNNLSGTIGLSKNIDQFSKLFFNYSIASRAPNPSELFSEGLHHSAARVELGDLSFKREIGHKLGFTYLKNKNNLSLTVNPYINFVDDFMLIIPTEIRQTNRGNFQVWEYMQTNARIWGLDLDMSYQLNEEFSLKNQVSFLNGKDISNSTPLINMPPTNIKNEISYSSNKTNNLSFSIQSDYTFKQNRYPLHILEVFVAESGEMETLDLSTPPPGYHLLNFRSSILFKTRDRYDIKVGLNISNLFNKTYKNYLSRMRYYAHDLGRNIILNISLDY